MDDNKELELMRRLLQETAERERLENALTAVTSKRKGFYIIDSAVFWIVLSTALVGGLFFGMSMHN